MRGQPEAAVRWVGTFSAALFAAWFVLAGVSRDALLVEDGPIETATAVVFFVAAVAGIRAMTVHGGRRLYWIIPASAALAVLDEVSFGARIFGFTGPTIAGVEVDSLHDVVDIADRVLGDVGIGRTMVVAVVLAAGAALVAGLVATGRMGRLLRWWRAHRPMWFLAAAIGMLVSAVVIDQLWATSISRFVEEMLEFAAAFAMVLGVIAVIEEPAVVEVTA